MKAADFHLTARHFFGALLPGMMWLLVVAVDSSDSMLEFFGRLASASTSTWVLVFAAGLLVGTIMQPLTAVVNSVVRLVDGKGDHQRRNDLYLAAYKRLASKYPLALHSLLSDAATSIQSSADTRREIFVACRRVLIAKRSQLGALLVDIDVAQNLLAGFCFPFPLLAAAIARLFAAVLIDDQTRAAKMIAWILIAMTIEAGMLRALHAFFVESEDVCIGSFLVQESVDSATNGHTSDTLNLQDTESE